MKNNQPWYDTLNSLGQDNFFLNNIERDSFIRNYKRLIDFSKNTYNYSAFNHFENISFIEDDYCKDEIKERFVSSFLSWSKILYAMPIVFSYDDFNYVVNGFNPSLIVKVNSDFIDYKKCLNSLIADYTGEFLMLSEDFNSFIVLNPGHYFICGGKKNIESHWREFILGHIDMYDYDKLVIEQFLKNINNMRLNK